ncbi:MAG: hypothetical protein K0A93_11425 [Desulfuromonadaceae bacterium]|nr:hypothetical protein [Desulfuromonadaceae bacterium]
MLLIFLLILALLVIAIGQELDRRNEVTEPPSGKCPGCDFTVDADWLLCPRCKELLRTTCVCGKHLPVFYRYCVVCGAPRTVRDWR